MARLSALIFDVDGTLADTERDGHRVAFNLAFEEAGLDWDWTPELYGKLLTVSGGKERIRYFLDEFKPDFPRPSELNGFIADLHELKTCHYLKLLRRGGMPLRPGVQRLLVEAASQGLVLAIATTTTPANVEHLLVNTLGADALEDFAVIAAGDIVPAKKPAPDVYHYALGKLGLDADQCVAIEDSDNGLHSSLAAGITTLVTVNNYTRDQDFTGAALVVDHLGEPSRPMQVIAGAAPPGMNLVNVEFLRRLLE